MPLLASCWFIIESIVIPQGFAKWFYLSFYIHPVFLCFCQIVIRIKLIQRWYLLLIVFLWRLVLWISSSCTLILRFLKSLAFLSASPAPAAAATAADSDSQALNEKGTVENELLQVIGRQNQIVVYDVISILDVKLEETHESPGFILLDDSFDFSTKSPSSAEVEPDSTGEGRIFSNNIFPVCSSLSSSNLVPLELDMHSNELVQPESMKEEEVDSVYFEYEQKMKWFDLLSRDRLFGIDAIQKMASPPWSEKAKENLTRSLRSDFELVYVAQTCLSWDALHHHYSKVEAIAESIQNDRVVFFSKETADRFQEFHVLLERFVEDEQITAGPRNSNYVQRRFSHKKLLQVPAASVLENDNLAGEVMNVKATQVLKIIENCIKVFWIFLKDDTKKPTWKIQNSLCTRRRPAVEDPRDLQLLYDLRKIVRKKELLLKNLEGKKDCWWKKAVQVQVGYQKVDEFLFAMIDLKLVKNVLQMLIISTSQLKWCQKKLDNIEITQRKICRSATDSDAHYTYLFPSCSS